MALTTLTWMAGGCVSALLLQPGAGFNFSPLHVPSRARFPSPTSYTPGWHPLCLSKNLRRNEVKRIEFVDEALAIWRDSKGAVFSHPDCCPHLGAMLSEGKALKNGCLQCPYHGLCVGESPVAADVAPVGVCTEQDGIVWWNRFATAAPEASDPAPRLPRCEPMLEAAERKKPTISFEIELEGSFNDALRNSFDVYHPAFVHASSFGNNLGAPSSLTEKWTDGETMRLDFEYKSNERFEKRTGKTTANHHVFMFPSTVYNQVAAKGRSLLIHIAMRATSATSCMWFVTAASDFVPHEKFLEQAVRRVAAKEDAGQIAMMAPEDMKAKYAYRMGLPLDAHTAGFTFGVGVIRAAEERLMTLLATLPSAANAKDNAGIMARAWAEATELMRWEEAGWHEASKALTHVDIPASAVHPMPLTGLEDSGAQLAELNLRDWDCLAELALPHNDVDSHAEAGPWHVTEQEAEQMFESAVQRNNIIPAPWARKAMVTATSKVEKPTKQAVIYKSERMAIIVSSEQSIGKNKDGGLPLPKSYTWGVWRKPDTQLAEAAREFAGV